MNSNDRNKRKRPAAGRPRPVNQRRPEGTGQPSPRKPDRGAVDNSADVRRDLPEGMSVWEIARLEEKQRLAAQRERARRQAAEVRRLQALAQPEGRTGQSPRQRKSPAGRSAQARAAQARTGQGRTGQGRTGQGRTGQGRSGQARGEQARTGQARNSAARGRRRPQPNVKGRPRSKASSKARPQSLRQRLSRFVLTRWMVPKQPLAKLNAFDRYAWILLYTGIVLVILVALVYSVVKTTEVNKDQTEAASVRSTTEVPVSVYQCKVSDLEMSVKLPASQIDAGAPVQFGLTITNRSDYPCTINADPRNLGIYIMSGQETIYNPGTCAEKTQQALLIDAKTTIEHKITWDSKLRDEKCAVTENASPGTYVATPYLEHKLDSPAAPFVIK